MRHRRDADHVVRTERLILRPLEERDLDDLAELDSDPEVLRYLNGGRPISRERIETEILPRLLAIRQRSGDFGYWAAIEKGSQTFLGWFELVPLEDGGADELELGYRLRRAAWGKGFATEGARALLDRAFSELGARRVVARTMAVNLRSRRVMEKLGLRLVRTFHGQWAEPIEGSEQGDVEYAIDAAEWNQRRRLEP